ncbi:CgeB family protein [Chengkuizengella axinellae]|uniref:Glycosyltransferase n=1 Tax=Chengkuizengella axinellae TaxID=3064388 RepID=A0ABT9J1Q2_9BACL|nr:glycosyltransferase [Chengkuizengella sp. 2205SS18-9]MDP5275510.1 glycosyltransferase [Chengkuizengella sp. 2205SS18-9]
MKFIKKYKMNRNSNHYINNDKNKKKLKILYVQSGKRQPYVALEESLIKYFKKEIPQFHTILPHEHIHKVAQEIKPHLILVFDGWNFSVTKIKVLKRLGFVTAVWLLDDPYYTDITEIIAPKYDYIFTVESGCIDFYKSLGCKNVNFLPLAVDPDIFKLNRNVEAEYKSDVLFVGNAHPDRVDYFKEIEAELLKRNIGIIGPGWEEINDSLLTKTIIKNNWITPEETAKYYNGAKIVINMHRSIDNPNINRNTKVKINALSVNPRTFEIAACGAFQLTDIRKDLYDLYTPGHDIATYKTSIEMIRKMDYYLYHSDKRQSMAAKAMEKTLQNETYSIRVNQLLEYLTKELKL